LRVREFCERVTWTNSFRYSVTADNNIHNLTKPGVMKQ